MFHLKPFSTSAFKGSHLNPSPLQPSIFAFELFNTSAFEVLIWYDLLAHVLNEDFANHVFLTSESGEMNLSGNGCEGVICEGVIGWNSSVTCTSLKLEGRAEHVFHPNHRKCDVFRHPSPNLDHDCEPTQPAHLCCRCSALTRQPRWDNALTLKHGLTDCWSHLEEWAKWATTVLHFNYKCVACSTTVAVQLVP